MDITASKCELAVRWSDWGEKWHIWVKVDSVIFALDRKIQIPSSRRKPASSYY